MQGEAFFSATVAANGTAVAEIRASARQSWAVKQVSTELPNAPAGSTSMLRKNGALVTSMVAPGDVASGDPAVQLAAGDVLTVEWAGCTPGVTGQVYVIYDDGVTV